MNVIPEGSTKYILFNDVELQRNKQRRNGGAPAVVVAEVDETVRGGFVFHTGYSALFEGQVATVFGGTNGTKAMFEFPNGYFGRRTKVHAALMTTDKVFLSTDRDEVLSIKTKAPTKPKATKATEEKSK